MLKNILTIRELKKIDIQQ